MAFTASSSVRPQLSARVRPCVLDAEMSKKSPYRSSSTSQAPGSKSNSPAATNAMPSWLLSTIADLEERVRSIEAVPSEDDGPLDTFAQRAETYYRKRPQLLSLLRDLYNAYVSLSDRYFHVVAKRSSRYRMKRSPSQMSIHSLSEPEDGEAGSEAESSLSFQKSSPTPTFYITVDADMLVAELVTKNVERDILLHEVNLMERWSGESSRKMDLQENLLEVLESERMILLSQNTELGHQVVALMEENQVLATESELMKTRAAELAKCIWKIREEGCVGELSCKIDDLKDRIFGLEKQNKEYYGEIVRRGGDGEGRGCSLLGCFEFQKWKLREVRAARGRPIKNAGVRKKKASKWWAKVSKMDIFKCGINPTSASGL
ncbi:hypothetical protein SAY86_006308 [Trapa natans]|uniref:NAB domain-containing protein n=1 Tax=Trapa natans TaxID=22666 RepID=A0AAN7LBT2_TRANT|nr:hypothetical protein SAY86_006308 [Trapa natans]